MSDHGDEANERDESGHEPHPHDTTGGPGSTPETDFDAAWAAIVSHYDDPIAPADPSVVPPPGLLDESTDTVPRPTLPETVAGEPVDPDPGDPVVPTDHQLPHPTPGADLDAALAGLHEPDPIGAWSPAEDPDDGTFIPAAPPLPQADWKRRSAWLGLLGSPVVLLLMLFVSYQPPQWFFYTLIGAFLGGFGYLVATMDDTPRDPWDDGSRV